MRGFTLSGESKENGSATSTIPLSFTEHLSVFQPLVSSLVLVWSHSSHLKTLCFNRSTQLFLICFLKAQNKQQTDKARVLETQEEINSLAESLTVNNLLFSINKNKGCSFFRKRHNLVYISFKRLHSNAE